MPKKLSLFIITLLFLFTANTAYAVPKEKPIEIISDNISTVLELIKKPEFKTDQTIKDEVFTIITSLFSWKDMGIRALGRIWKEQTPAQQDAFIEAFTKMLKNNYFHQLEAYTSEKVTYKDERIKGKYAEVQTFIIRADGTQTPVYYRLITTKDNQWKIYDVVIEGVSMVKNYRTQFDELLKKNSFDEFIAKINDKAEENKTQKTA